MFLLLLWFIFMVIPHRSNAQNQQLSQSQKVDSLTIYLIKSKNDSLSPSNRKNQLLRGFRYAEKIPDDTVKAKAFSRLSYAYFKDGDSSFFRLTNRIAISLAIKIKDSLALAEAYWDRGAFFQNNAIPDSAYYSFSVSQKVYESKGNILNSSRMLLYMAHQQEVVKDYVGSESNLVLAIKWLKQINNHKYLRDAYNQLGIVANGLGEYEKAIDYYKEALIYAHKLNPNNHYSLMVKNNIGVVYKTKQDFPKAIESFKNVLATDSIKLVNIGLYSKTLNNLAFSKIRDGDTAGTKALVAESIRIKDSLGLTSSLATSYASLAEYYLFGNDTLSAVKNFNIAKQIAEESSNNDRLLETLAFLNKIDRENASKHGQAYIALNEEIQNEERQARNKFARIRFETDELSAENEVLSEEKDILSEEKELLSKQNQIWAALAAGFFLFALAIYIIVNQRTKNQKLRFQQQQQFSNQEIFNLMLAQKQKVDEVKRMEQKRISEELHDGVLGKMLGARMVLTGLNKKGTEQAIHERSEAIVALKNIENELRAISHELSHTAYRKINNFVNSIETLLSSATHKTSIRTVFNYDEDADWDFLIGDIKINVYRIIQENIQNAIKHSGCSNFFVNFEIKGDLYIVTIGDDGKGFSFDREQKGIGLRNIKSRVKKMRGSLNVKTGLGNGTEMTLEIPTQYSNPVIDDSIN